MTKKIGYRKPPWWDRWMFWYKLREQRDERREEEKRKRRRFWIYTFVWYAIVILTVPLFVLLAKWLLKI